MSLPSRLTRLPVLLVLTTMTTLPTPSLAEPPSHVPDEVIVKWKPGVGESQRAEARGRLRGRKHADLGLIRAEVVKLRGMSVEEAIDAFRNDPRVEYAEPNWIVRAFETIPNDPRFGELYALRNTGQTGGTPGADIKATLAWDLSTGSASVKVGIIDTGIDYNHPDLAANIWTNTAEASGTAGLDDDGNGYVDDVHGYDFFNNDGNPMDDNNHGTHVSGTIAAVGNNGIGVTGINWRCSLVGIKFLGAGGSGDVFGAIRAVEYALAVGVQLTNNSWGGGGFSQALLEAIEAAGAANQLFVAAAGNSASDNDINVSYPSGYDSPYIVAVAATNAADQLTSFSSYGAASVDLGAPGEFILSTVRNGGYASFSGTSMATPHVVGACALLYARYPGMSNLTIKDFIVLSAEPLPALVGRCVSEGRLDAYAALQATPDVIPPAPITDLRVSFTGSTRMSIAWTSSGDDGLAGNLRRYEIRSSTAPLDAGNFSSGKRLSPPFPAPPGTLETLEVPGLTYDTTYYFAVKAFDEWGNSVLSNIAAATTLGAPELTATALGSVQLASGSTATQQFLLTNSGEGLLEFTIPAPEQLFDPPASAKTAPRLPATKPTASPAQAVIDAYGGPDGFGYRWSDSDQPGGPTFDWQDISMTGTRVSFWGHSNMVLGPYPLGFDFPYYGQVVNEVWLSARGYVALAFTHGADSKNHPFPTFEGSRNMVAPFWADFFEALDPNSQVQYYYESGPDRFVFSWINEELWSAPGRPCTFQVILYPSGEIRFQYLDMGPLVDQASIGIQNYDRDLGLTVLHNAPYMHDGLGIRLRPMRQWLSVAPSTGSIPAGQQVALSVRYDATGFIEGTYGGVVHVLTNAPTPQSHYSTTMAVSGAPQASWSTTAVDLGLVFVGSTRTTSVSASNSGTAPLTVTGIVSSDPQLTAAPGSFTLAPGASTNVTLTYSPSAPSTLAATLTLASNDPVHPARILNVSGSANLGPQVHTGTTSFGLRLPVNGSETTTMQLGNIAPSGSELLQFVLIPTVFEAGAVLKPSAPVYEQTRELPEGIEGSGGPDGFGYRWVDSDAPGGPSFVWEDIRQIGTRLDTALGDDAVSAPVTLPFSFPFYGQVFTALRACSNGWLSFTSPLTSFTNTGLPDAGAGTPENLLAPFWDDLLVAPTIVNPEPGIYYFADANHAVVSFLRLRRSAKAGYQGLFSFQVLLYPGGKIVYQYLDMLPPEDGATIGIQDGTRSMGLQVVRDAAYIHDDLAIAIQRTPDWLSVSPTSGSLAGGSSTDVEVRFDATGLAPGDYHGRVRVQSNDPNAGIVDLPVTLQVTSPTDVESNLPRDFAARMTSPNPATGVVRLALALPQRAPAAIRVYNVRGHLVRSLSTDLDPGTHDLVWDGNDGHQGPAPNGVYFVRVHLGPDYERTLRVVLMR